MTIPDYPQWLIHSYIGKISCRVKERTLYNEHRGRIYQNLRQAEKSTRILPLLQPALSGAGPAGVGSCRGYFRNGIGNAVRQGGGQRLIIAFRLLAVLEGNLFVSLVLQFLLDDLYWTEEERMKIAQWLFTPDNQFHNFVSEDYNLVFSLQFTDGQNFDNYNNQGYVTFQAEMQHPYPFTIPAEQFEDLSDNDATTIIEVENKSNVVEYYNPLIQFELVGDTNTFKIKNLTVSGEETIFTNLTPLDTVNVDCLTQRIESVSGNNYIDNFNFVFPRLVYGVNRLEITGKCYLTIKTSFPIII
jgi:hypothetical protein